MKQGDSSAFHDPKSPVVPGKPWPTLNHWNIQDLDGHGCKKGKNRCLKCYAADGTEVRLTL
ncbi:hypothetical protein C5167_012822 [Papaver somniferum]|uniref:Uncharacterized protein n=1 Tax=Papaver somniferum TaxID=3469 RepID=A0A4Y7J2K3_PAPSO|nr:hypothetical protein C5167_012822 [Papaver somniferum]